MGFTVKHQELLQCLKTTDIEENDIALIANLYWQQKTIVKINNDISEPLKIEKGVRQGCVLSPALFNLYTDIIFRNIDQRPGIKIGGHTMNNLRYMPTTLSCWLRTKQNSNKFWTLSKLKARDMDSS